MPHQGGLARAVQADQRHAVGFKAVVEFNIKTGVGEVAFAVGDVEWSVLRVGNVAHRQTNGSQFTGILYGFFAITRCQQTNQ